MKRIIIVSIDKTFLSWKTLPEKIAEVQKTLATMRNVTFDPIETVYRDLSPVVEDGRIARPWFDSLSGPLYAEGYDFVVLHMSIAQRDQLGVTPTLRGLHIRDFDAVGEAYVMCDEDTMRGNYNRFVQTTLHELRHAFCYGLGRTDDTHTLHGDSRDIRPHFRQIDMKNFNRISTNKMRLELYRPLITNRVTQPWGANNACKHASGKVVPRTGGTCPPGTRGLYETLGMQGHNGIDFAATSGEDIYHCGPVGWMKTERDMHGGIGVDVITNEPVQLDDGYVGHVKFRYWHLKGAVGHDGKQVNTGDIIGLADNTGLSSGDHLHFGMKKCDKNGKNLEPNNGWNGCFDPTHYMNFGLDARTVARIKGVPKQELTEQETKEIIAQLTIIQRLVRTLRELLDR